MKKIFTLILSFTLSLSLSAQEVVSAEYLESYDLDYFKEDLGVSFSLYGVDMYRVLYTTTGIDGALDTASGLMVIPQLEEELNFPLVSYSHGTVGSRFDVPGYLSFEANLPAIYASMGTVAIAADYLGLGYSKGLHPYVHADSEAWASYDMMTAIQDFLPNEMQTKLNGQVLLTGYSQGGHAAMALHRFMETEKNLDVELAMPMSGPYSISSGMRELFLSKEEYSVVAYMAWTALSYEMVYGTIYPNNDINQFFKAPYVEPINQFANEDIDLWTLDSILRETLIAEVGGAFPSEMVMDDIVEAINNDDNHPVNIALRDNDVYDWTPRADTRLLYCQGDEQVSYLNSLIARDTMNANGALQVSALNLADDFDHGQCVTPAATSFVFYLLAFSGPTGTNDISEISFNTFPNPSASEFTIGLDKGDLIVNAQIIGLDGRVLKTFSNLDNGNILQHNLETGMYLLMLTNSEGRRLGHQKIIVK